MTSRLLLFFLFLLAAKCGIAQDTLYKINHDKVIVKVEEIGPSEIRYKRYAAPDGPVYVVRKSEVWKIVYSDGTVETYNAGGSNMPGATQILSRRWTTGINAFDLMFGVITISGEYKLKNNWSVRIPVSTGIGSLVHSPVGYSWFHYYNKNKMFSVGIDGLYYPRGQQNVANYYVGIAAEYGKTNHLHGWGYSYYTVDYYFATGIVNGVMLNVSDRLRISIDAKLGMNVPSGNDNSFWPMMRLGITMAYNFGNTLAPKTK